MISKQFCRNSFSRHQSVLEKRRDENGTGAGRTPVASARPGFRRHFRKRFTLLELLICVALIAILVSLLLPALTKVRQKARSITCVGNLKTMNQFVSLYSLDHSDIIPVSGLDVENYIGALQKGLYLRTSGKYVSMCPESDLSIADKSPGKTAFIRNYSYGINYLGSWRHSDLGGSIKQVVSENDGDSVLNFKRLRFPSRFVLLLDTKRKNLLNNGPKAVFFGGDVGTWGANPWIIHTANTVAAAYGDGHAQMTSVIQLKEQVNKSVKCAFWNSDPL
ncbi:MAG: hypothetical protein V8T90_07100 [Victivallales bacterium]